MPGTGLFPVSLASEPLGFSHPARPEPYFSTSSFSGVSQKSFGIEKLNNCSPQNALQMPCYHTARVASVAVHPR